MHRNTKIRGNRGFTLVELLVVMAIIAILASIVVPNVAKYITRSRMTNAVSEVKNAETAFVGMLSDAQVANFRQFFSPTPPECVAPDCVWQFDVFYQPGQAHLRMLAAQQYYTEVFYELMRNGKFVDADTRAKYGLRDEVVNKLGTNYMDIDRDPWGQLYNVYAGPWRPPVTDINDPYWDTINVRNTPFRIRSITENVPGGPTATDGFLNFPDGPYIGPSELPIYIWSSGQNLVSGQKIYGTYDNPEQGIVGGYWDQEQENMGGGDDINNWDSGQSWQELYG